MAHATLPSLPCPSFPQVLSQALDQEITRVPQLSVCCYVYPVEGFAGGGYECGEVAVVHQIATEQDFCARHWKAASRG